ncbi:MAG: hypothetical protein MI741_13490 [Rhodospirillales bacterium]|nr:hypothetical protein [Rhodospirillales bacterium]
MTQLHGAANAEERARERPVRYSICTLVNDADDYGAMVESFRANGFREPECEFIYIDNRTENRFDAFAGYNLFLATARGTYVILCHQDVLLLDHGIERLDALIAELDRDYPDWGLLGNAGADDDGRLAIRISDPFSPADIGETAWGPFPAEVGSLDENFIVARGAANIGVSRDITGFHLYGTDLCLHARARGYRAFVVDFLLRHKSPGTVNRNFREVEAAMVAKNVQAWKPRWVTTTCTVMFLSGWRWLSRLGNGRFVIRQILNRNKRLRRGRECGGSG